jgi:hypothetical protein
MYRNIEQGYVVFFSLCSKIVKSYCISLFLKSVRKVLDVRKTGHDRRFKLGQAKADSGRASIQGFD